MQFIIIFTSYFINFDIYQAPYNQTTQIKNLSSMQIQRSTSHFLQFNTVSRPQNFIQQTPEHYFKKHWQVIQTSIKYFLLEKAPINIVAFKKSLQLLIIHKKGNKLNDSLNHLWNELFSQILRKVQDSGQQAHPLISLLQYYKEIEDRFKIIFTLLQSYLQKTQKSSKVDGIDQFGNFIFHQKETPEKNAFNILCRLILNSPSNESYTKEMLLLIDAFRNSNYSDQNVISEESCKNQVKIDLLIVKKIGLFRHLQENFYQSSKDFYVGLASQIPKDQNFLSIVNEYLQRQIQLSNIFEPKQSTVYYLQKQLIRENYGFILDKLLEKIIQKKEIYSLKIFWRFTLRLGEQAMKKLFEKLKTIIVGTKKYFTLKNSKQDVFKLIEFRENLFEVIDKCFDKNRKIVNIVYNTFQQIIYEQEKQYLDIALQNVLQEGLTTIKASHMRMILEGQQEQKEVTQQMQSFDKNKIFKLFRISPSKQNFIRQFEIRFCRWILNQGFNLKSLKMQEKMVAQMKKQVGNNLMRKLDRMLNDVWRNDKMHYQTQIMRSGTKLNCIFLSNDWPVQLSLVFNIPDELYNMLMDFQLQYRSAIQNKQKQIKWLNEVGTLIMNINGVQSIFSAVEASIIMLLDKSIRPLRKQQIEASLNICNLNPSIQSFSPQEYLTSILQNLTKHNILTFNTGSSTYDINDENTVHYRFVKIVQEKTVSTIKRSDTQKDNSVLIQAAIVKILKKRKNMQRSDITRFIEESIKNFKPSFQQITKAFEALKNRQFIQINRSKGIISYIE